MVVTELENQTVFIFCSFNYWYHIQNKELNNSSHFCWTPRRNHRRCYNFNFSFLVSVEKSFSDNVMRCTNCHEISKSQQTKPGLKLRVTKNSFYLKDF